MDCDSAARQQLEIDAAQERLHRMKNAVCERAMKMLALSDAQSMMHYCFGVWHAARKDARQQAKESILKEESRLYRVAKGSEALRLHCEWQAQNAIGRVEPG